MKGIQITKEPDYSAQVADIPESALPEKAVKIDVAYSTINYKDALAVTGKGPVVRAFPLVPGIDFAGTVTASSDERYKVGDKVIANGWGMGEKHWGGLAQMACVDADWLVPLPEGMTEVQAMSIGTAGYTAMLCVLALQENGVSPEDGQIIVSGATGGVGSVAVYLLNKLGYQITAVTGKSDSEPYLKSLGASEIIARDTISEQGKPLQKELWAGAVDVAGGHTLANICAQMKYEGVVTACGLAQSMALPSTVAPFILRGVKLVGVDSVYQPYARRAKAWDQLANLCSEEFLSGNTKEISLDEVVPMCEALMAGKVTGRLVVNPN